MNDPGLSADPIEGLIPPITESIKLSQFDGVNIIILTNIGFSQFEARSLWRKLRFYMGKWIESIWCEELSGIGSRSYLPGQVLVIGNWFLLGYPGSRRDFGSKHRQGHTSRDRDLVLGISDW